MWSLLPNVEYGLALNGAIRKGWNLLEPDDYEIEEEEDLPEEKYYHKPVGDKGHVPQYGLARHGSPGSTEAYVPHSPRNRNGGNSIEICGVNLTFKSFVQNCFDFYDHSAVHTFGLAVCSPCCLYNNLKILLPLLPSDRKTTTGDLFVVDSCLLLFLAINYNNYRITIDVIF